MDDCAQAAALANFLYWAQTSPAAGQVADRQGFVLVTNEAQLRGQFLNQLKAFTCDGDTVSHVANCINDGQLCSGAGVCTNNKCLCNTGREGQYCEGTISGSSDNTLVIALGKLPTLFFPTQP
jgi:hypothetical protein